MMLTKILTLSVENVFKIQMIYFINQTAKKSAKPKIKNSLKINDFCKGFENDVLIA